MAAKLRLKHQNGVKGSSTKGYISHVLSSRMSYNKVESVTLVCYLAHARRKFFEAIPAEKRKNLKLLDIDCEKEKCTGGAEQKMNYQKTEEGFFLVESFLWNFYTVYYVPLTIEGGELPLNG